MIDWLAELFTHFINGLPTLLVDESSPGFAIVRAMLGLIVIAAVIVALAFLPSVFRAARAWLSRPPKPPTEIDKGGDQHT